jgi:hypothetical protein
LIWLEDWEEEDERIYRNMGTCGRGDEMSKWTFRGEEAVYDLR